MIRLIGAAMMIAGASAWGLLGVWRLKARAQTLFSLCAALGEIRNEVACRLTPVPEVIARVSQDGDGPVAAFFRRVEKKLPLLGSVSFGELWRQAAEESPEMLLRETEKTALSAFGQALGRYDAETQERELSYLLGRFEGFLRDAETEKKRDARMHAALGLAAGLFCVIILL